MGKIEFEYIETLGYLSGQRIGRVVPKEYDKSMSDSKKLKHAVPILAVDGVVIELKTGYKYGATMKTFQIPEADILFSVNKGDESEVVSAVRLTNHQIEELIDTLQDSLRQFHDQNK